MDEMAYAGVGGHSSVGEMGISAGGYGDEVAVTGWASCGTQDADPHQHTNPTILMGGFDRRGPTCRTAIEVRL